MKTPEEIKAHAIDESGCCGVCELYHTTVDNPFGCQEAQAKTALVAELVAYTEKLESENADLKSRLAQAERERDAAVADVTAMLENCDCEVRHVYCSRSTPPFECNADECKGYARWRGVCPENTKEE